MDQPTPLSLLTFPPMIDSECSRFVLARYQLDFTEAPHLFGWASVLSTLKGATPQIPLLTGKGVAVAGPHAIVDKFEATVATDRRLIPSDAYLASQVDADWARFNGTLGSAAAVIGYFYLLPERQLMLEPFSRGVPKGEATLVPMVYPALAALFRLLLGLSQKHADESLDIVRTIFEETDRRLAGKIYLVGDTLTLSDIALATACGPLILPEHYGSPMPPLEAMPSKLQAIIAELRARDTGRYVADIYRHHRLG